MRHLRDIDVSGKRVFLRADLDVGEVLKAEGLTTNARLQNLKPTIDSLISHNAKQIVIAGHIGRPNRKQETGNKKQETPDFYDEKLSTKHLIEPIEKILGQKIEFSPQLTITNQQSTIILLENLRFWEGEEKNDPEFAKQLAALADVYINEAFGVCHRAHASVVGVPAILPHAAGLHLEEELETLSKLLKTSQRPMVAIIGGAKLETKIPVIESLSRVADKVLIGGLIAQRFIARNTSDVQSQNTSGVNQVGTSGNLMIATFIPDGKDIDDESIEKFRGIIKTAKTVVWNGPMGYFEGGFERGTLAIAQAVIDSGAYSVIGGGETTEFLGSKNLLSKFSFVSSGGGAMLEFLAGRDLPGLKVLD